MPDKERIHNPRHLSAFAAKPILSLVNEVRHQKRRAVTFISDGKGGLIETHTNMPIKNDPSEVERLRKGD